MEFMTTNDAVKKWGISERRIRQLLQDGRIEGAIKVGNNWNIPINANKPADKRSVKLDNTEFKFDLPDNYFDKVDELNKELNSKRPISKETLKSLKESINLEWTYNSNGIEGNTLTLRETQVVLEGITVGGKSLKEHLEVINHEQAILFLDDLIKDKEPITEWNIKNIHQLVLKEIDDNAGKYRDENVKIKGATHIPPDYLIVPELMEKLIINYEDWKKYHPIIRAALLHGELVKIHPFVDGNSRTFRTFTKQVANSAGFLLDWDKTASSDQNRDALYCARGICANNLALSDPLQANFKEYIQNMNEDISFISGGYDAMAEKCRLFIEGHSGTK